MEQGSCSSSRKAVAVDCRRAMLLERSYKTFRIRLARSFFPVHRELCRAIHRICPATMRGRYEAPIYTYWNDGWENSFVSGVNHAERRLRIYLRLLAQPETRELVVFFVPVFHPVHAQAIV